MAFHALAQGVVHANLLMPLVAATISFDSFSVVVLFSRFVNSHCVFHKAAIRTNIALRKAACRPA